MILSVLLGGMWTSSVFAGVHVKGMLSTGETFDGRLLRDDGQLLSVKGEKRTCTFMTANIVEYTIRVADENIPTDVQGIPLGGYAKFLLTKGHDFLAESTLLCALARTVKQGQGGELTLLLWAMERTQWEELLKDSPAAAIKAMYTDTHHKLPVRLGGAKSRTWRPRRYQLPSPSAIASALKKSDDWGRQMRQITSRTHRIETAHFVIYSAWSKTDDTKLKSIYEKLYTALCKQFDMPATENIWIGKLSVFAFWEKKDFVKFYVNVCGLSKERAQKSGGVAGSRGWYQYVNLGPVMSKGRSKASARTRFYKLLVHESTHAFTKRYIKYKRVTSWLNEGIAEVLSAMLVPASNTSQRLQAAHTLVKQGKGAKFLPMLTAQNIPIEYEYYGAAQSLARFLLSKGKIKFIQLVSEFKNGSGSEDALRKVYGLSHKTLLQQWARQIR